jgi:hypothetical protein
MVYLLHKTKIMKKVYLSFAVFSVFSLNTMAQQLTDGNTLVKDHAAVRTTKHGKAVTAPAMTEKSEGEVVWYNNFTPGPNNAHWSISGTQTDAEHGWRLSVIGSGSQGTWAYTGSDRIASTSSGGYALVKNGSPVSNPTTHLPNAEFIMAFDSVFNLSSYAATGLNFNFQQYGALFYDMQVVEASIDNGATWVELGNNNDMGILSADGGADYPNPTNRSYSVMNAFEEGSDFSAMKFRFRLYYPAGLGAQQNGVTYGWFIDDVKLVEAYDNDLKVTDIFSADIETGYEAFITPLSQATSPVVIGVAVENMGGAAQTQDVTVKIKLAGNTLYTGTVSAALEAGTSDTVFLTTTFTPNTIGTYTVVAQLPTDDVTAGNKDSITFQISDYIYAQDRPSTSVYRFNIDDEVAMGNVFRIFEPAVLKAVDIKFATGTTAGMELEVYVYKVGASIQALQQLFSVGFNVQANQIGTGTTSILVDNLSLEPGFDYVVEVRKPNVDSDRLFLFGSALGDEDFSTVNFGPFGANEGVNWFVNWGFSPSVRMNFNPVLSTTEITAENQLGLSVYPNPAVNGATVAFKLNNEAAVNVTVTDLTGKVAFSTELGTQLSGEHTASINTESMAAGVYMVNVTANGTVSTQKLVVRK